MNDITNKILDRHGFTVVNDGVWNIPEGLSQDDAQLLFNHIVHGVEIKCSCHSRCTNKILDEVDAS